MKIALALVPFAEADAAAIRSLAGRIDAPPPPSGRSRERELHQLAGRAALALALDAVGHRGPLGADPRWGYPTVPGCHVTLSHTDGLAAAAVGPRPVGVDVERRDRDVSRVLDRVLHPVEREDMARFHPPFAEPLSPGILLWCGKEAFAKALGLGLQAGFSDIRIVLAEPPPYRVLSDVTGPMTLARPRLHVETLGPHLITLCGEERDLAELGHRVIWKH